MSQFILIEPDDCSVSEPMQMLEEFYADHSLVKYAKHAFVKHLRKNSRITF